VKHHDGMSTAIPPRLFDDFSFYPADGRLEHLPSGSSLQLRPQVARLLLALLDAEGGVVAREALYRAIWDQGTVVDFEAGLAALVRELRQALDQLGGQAGLLETIPRRGYRLRSAPAPEVPPTPAGKPAPTLLRRPWLVALVAVLVLASSGWWLASREPEAVPAVAAPAGAGNGSALAVLPFQSYGQPATNGPRLELLLADAFLSELWRAELDGVVLIGRATLMPYGDREDIAPAVARDLGVQLLVEGSLVREGADWLVTARLLAMPGGRVLWSDMARMPVTARPPVAETVTTLATSLAAAWPGIRREMPTP
jgi:DNA-binding winged helix-turn-helix (wHTH) protein/TolB-like protein